MKMEGRLPQCVTKIYLYGLILFLRDIKKNERKHCHLGSSVGAYPMYNDLK